MKPTDKEIRKLAVDMIKHCSLNTCFVPECKYAIKCNKLKHVPIVYSTTELAEELRRVM